MPAWDGDEGAGPADPPLIGQEGRDSGSGMNE